jgi:GxxExxY protein
LEQIDRNVDAHRWQETSLTMHENEISERIIGAAIEVHKYYGPGLVEQIYEEALCHEFRLRGIQFERQKQVPIYYKSIKLGVPLRLDLIVEEKVIVDLKAKEAVIRLDEAKLLSYLRLSDLRLGLIVNFHALVLKDGIPRVVNGLKLPPPEPGSFTL